MTPTETMLAEKLGGPLVKLEDICEEYFGCAIVHARRKAGLNQLPVPTWRLIDSQRAPYMVRLTDLASHIDAQAAHAQAAWDNSQT